MGNRLFWIIETKQLKHSNMKAQQNTQTSAKEKMLFALLFVVPAIAAVLIEILTA